MNSFKDAVYTYAGFAVSAALTVILLFMTPYTGSWDYKIEPGPVIVQILGNDRQIFLDSPNHSAALVCQSGGAVWFTMLLPLICSLPFLPLLSAELKGNYRLKLSRERSSKDYWNRTFFRSTLFGAGAAAAGYLIFCAAIYCVLPRNSDFPDRATLVEGSREWLRGRLELGGFLNGLFSTQNEYVFILNQTVNVFLYSAAVSAFCLLLYLIFMNKYRALGIPVMLFYLADRITDELAFSLHRWAWPLNPKYLVFQTETALSEFPGVGPGWYFAIIAIPVLLFYFAGGALFKRRMTN